MYVIAILLSLLITTILPVLVCGFAGGFVGLVMSWLMRQKSWYMAKTGTLVGSFLGGLLYLFLNRFMLNSYLESNYPKVYSTVPNEIYGRELTWPSSTPYWLMFGTMLLAGLLTGAMGALFVRKTPNQSP